MKIRHSFVSNSSSTSFTCTGCTEHFIGYNGEYDIEHTHCDKCGDTLCVYCYDEFSKNDNCPICDMTLIPEWDKADWMQMKLGMTDEQIFEAMREEANQKATDDNGKEIVCWDCGKTWSIREWESNMCNKCGAELDQDEVTE